MRIWKFLASVVSLSIVGSLALANTDGVVDAGAEQVAEEAAPEYQAPASDGMTDDAVAWDDFDSADFVPGDPKPEAGDASSARADEVHESVELVAVSPAESWNDRSGIQLGPVGVDADGQVGRVHTVRRGDTLWDISQTYLGTAWVWPSVWGENDEIENPHVIEPGDRIWITSTEIRPVSDEEADSLLAEAERIEEPNSEYEEVAGDLPADFDPEVYDEYPAADDEFAEATDIAYSGELTDELSEGLDALPVGMPGGGGRDNFTGRDVQVAMRENMSFVSDTQLQAATSILGSVGDRLQLSMQDTIFLGLGEGEVEVGDELTFFRNITEVRSPSTRQFLGYHVDVLGWAEVTEVGEESSVAVIRVSIAPAIQGDRAIPRFQPPTQIEVKYAEEGLQGEIAFMPAGRTLMGTTDYVFVDLGAVHGVEIGTDLEVYVPGQYRMDRTKNMRLRTLDRVVADLVVITVQEESSVAYVANTRGELAVGDVVRGATRNFPNAF